MKRDSRGPSCEKLLVGIDVGSTTTKMIAVAAETGAVLYENYKRHYAKQQESVLAALREFARQFPRSQVRIALTGSGAKPIADGMGLPFVQEVAANAIALQERYASVGSAIELGGQDAKMIFFRKDEGKGTLQVADMRMNGSCAGGTGAFIDEIASVLQVPVEEFNGLAEQGSCVYDISGRCGVYAKTDIQPLLNQGADKADLALSTFHAIAKQTIGGLAQGMEIRKPVAFEGGPLTFNPVLVRVFAERLSLSPEDILQPEHPELMVAYGAALALKTMFDTAFHTAADYTAALESGMERGPQDTAAEARPFFRSKEEEDDFCRRHATRKLQRRQPKEGEVVRAYLGIDSGSTTIKYVLMDENEELLDYFYGPNGGEPLMMAKRALIAMRDRYRKAGAKLEILAAGTTGYGEQLFSRAFQAEYHAVETVAHVRAVQKYFSDATFLLDIGGQDMKAIWMDHGVTTNILMNEACSSGCGSFLENFASALRIPSHEIARVAFSSRHPAVLGSRCTVFMNSSIITQQRDGRQPEDIMAGLCRSIIENVFTKVIRLSNLDSLGDRIVVQGGTFENDAVLRAMEEYLGREVFRSPYPGIMGAIGIALIAKERHQKEPERHTFLGLDGLDDFSYEQKSNVPCPFCQNHCKRTILTFSNGTTWITNNRCERGAVLGDPQDAGVRQQLQEQRQKARAVPNLFRRREELLLRRYPSAVLAPEQGVTIGIPRVLFFWETMPFWTTFFRSLGFQVRISDASTREMYESGLSAVTSDTICFPAKLVHGHLRNLASKGVDRIFMPSITTVPSENQAATSQSMCAVVKGYPIVVRSADNPQELWGIPFDAPLFHWYTREDRDRQLSQYMQKTFRIPERLVRQAIALGDQAEDTFHAELWRAGDAVLQEVRRTGKFAVVLASRPYQNDALVNHELPELFTGLGIPVLTADSISGANEVDLSKSRLDIVNNFHARMLSSAVLAASDPNLEYAQIVSFGCGHDAYLSDEITRLMKEISGKTPLILKLDESDIQGPLTIRVRSFLESVSMRREGGRSLKLHALKDPYPVKYAKENKKEDVVLIPNTSHAFSRLMAAAFSGQGVRAVSLEIGREEAIRLGKQYVHNDICFPAQIVIGEALAALKSGTYDPEHVAIGMGKYIGDCRLTHYGALLRKALDDAGFPNVAILTNDDVDYHNLHPGFRMNLLTAARIAFGLPMIDVLEELLRKIRPYELTEGSADRAFEAALDEVMSGMERSGISGAKKGFQRAIEIMRRVPYDRTHLRPQVLIVGEYLLNFHPGANHDIERYLEKNGFEVIEARMTDVIQKTYFYRDSQNREYHLKSPLRDGMWYRTANQIFDFAHNMTDAIAKAHPLYHPACRMRELVRDSDPILSHTFDAGEGVLIPGEILHHARNGCRFFIILQPFGCLPNHIVGRGISKSLKRRYPDIQILTLDYDPDVSFANVENRLQMLVINAKRQAQGPSKSGGLSNESKLEKIG